MAALYSGTLERLGFPGDTRAIILHADDLGMCLAENQATLAHSASGFAHCGAIMAPCPWVPQIIHAARSNSALDLGAHLTLTAEWRDYRWAPLTGRDPRSGLVDSEGCLWSSVADLHTHMDPASAVNELRAQVTYLLEQGVDLTHLDTHMGAVVHPLLLEACVELAFEFRLPILVPSSVPPEYIGQASTESWLAPSIERARQRLEQAGWPLVDHIASCSAPAERRLEGYLELIDNLPPGITHLLYHAAVPGAEIENIDRSSWQLRAADYRVMLAPAFRHALQERPDVSIIGYRALKKLIPA